MAYSVEFKKQWEKICAYMESEMIRTGESLGGIRLNQLVALLENEKKRWAVMGEYNYAWLEMLRRANAEVATEFEAALKSVSLVQEKPVERPSMLLAGCPAAAGALVGAGVPELLKRGRTWTLAGGICLTVIAGCAGYRVYRVKMDEALAAERKLYLAQMEAAGEKLMAILKKAD